MFGERLRNLRKEYNLTQKELGEKVEISDRVIGYYESGERFPSDEKVLKKLAEIFNCSVDYLLGRTNIRTPITTVAMHRTDGYDNDLPEEARKEIENFKEFIRQKYKKK